MVSNTGIPPKSLFANSNEMHLNDFESQFGFERGRISFSYRGHSISSCVCFNAGIHLNEPSEFLGSL